MDTKEKIAVMQAYVDGKSIEFANKNENNWLLMTADQTPLWAWSDLDYRIKPAEPRTFYVNEYKYTTPGTDTYLGEVFDKKAAVIQAGERHPAYIRTLTLVEKLDD